MAIKGRGRPSKSSAPTSHAVLFEVAPRAKPGELLGKVLNVTLPRRVAKEAQPKRLGEPQSFWRCIVDQALGPHELEEELVAVSKPRLALPGGSYGLADVGVRVCEDERPAVPHPEVQPLRRRAVGTRSATLFVGVGQRQIGVISGDLCQRALEGFAQPRQAVEAEVCLST